jgi:hypothetical protein
VGRERFKGAGVCDMCVHETDCVCVCVCVCKEKDRGGGHFRKFSACYK